MEALDGAEYEIVGNLDADIEFNSEDRDFRSVVLSELQPWVSPGHRLWRTV